MVDGSINGLLFGLGISLRLGDPRDDATGKSLDFSSHSGYFLEGSIVSEPTSLQPEAGKRELSFFSGVLAESRNQLEFVNSYLHDTGIPLPECIEEGLRMEQFTQVDSILEKGFSLGTLDPLDESRPLFVGNTNPSGRVLRAFPLFLPCGRDGVSHKLSGLGLGLGSKHFSTLQNFGNRGDTLVHSSEELHGTLHFHVYKLLNGVIGLTLGDLNIVEGLISLVNVSPKLADRAQSFSPLLLVKADFRGTHRSKALQLRDNLSTVETLDGPINVARQAEDLGVVNLRKLRDSLDESTRVLALSDLDDSSERLLTLHDSIREDLLHVRAQDPHVELVVDTSSVDGVLKQPKDLLPGWGLPFLGVNKSTKNLLSGLQITIGEFVVLNPALRNELTSLLDEGMEPRKQEHKRKLSLVLGLSRCRNDLLEGSLQVVANTRRSLVGNLQTGLQ